MVVVVAGMLRHDETVKVRRHKCVILQHKVNEVMSRLDNLYKHVANPMSEMANERVLCHIRVRVK